MGQRVLDGRVTLLDLIGQGGMGAVYLGEETVAGAARKVAVKFILMDVIGRSEQAEYRARFEREARVMVTLQHPSAVKLLGFGEVEGDLFMVQEFIDGITLHDLWRREGIMSFERAARLLSPVLRVLNEAHALGLVHRDLKPLNLMVQTFGEDVQTKVLDFGISKLLKGQADGTETRAGLAFGSPSYMAPEQSFGRPEPRSDLYAVGVILYQLITGQRPFEGEDDLQTIMLHRQGVIPTLPPTLSRYQPLIDRALAKAPSARFPSAMAFYEAIQRCLHGESISVKTPPYPLSAELQATSQLKRENSAVAMSPAASLNSSPLNSSPLNSLPLNVPKNGISFWVGALIVLIGAILSYFLIGLNSSKPVDDFKKDILDSSFSSDVDKPSQIIELIIPDSAFIMPDAFKVDIDAEVKKVESKPIIKRKVRKQQENKKLTPTPKTTHKKSWKVD
ncbi:serine/threonine protein kinase [Myxococcota bacterium]|nr:serine/threonine protein kinase [Myxococcota bacterium]